MVGRVPGAHGNIRFVGVRGPGAVGTGLGWRNRDEEAPQEGGGENEMARCGKVPTRAGYQNARIVEAAVH
jgi:hypothetical protein